jgi:hypothetical protein
VDLLDQREEGVSWGIIKNTAIEKYLANSDQEKYQELLKYAKLHENAENEDIYRTVREEDHVFVDWRSELYSQVKFIYSEKATKFGKIFTLLLTTLHTIKSKVKISQNFVAFSELYSLLKARDTYPGKFYVQKTRTISNFSSQGY